MKATIKKLIFVLLSSNVWQHFLHEDKCKITMILMVLSQKPKQIMNHDLKRC